MKNKLAILAILVLGVLIRTIFLNTSPPSLYGDELTILLDANSLLHSGRDQMGNFMPLTFPMGAGRPAGYVYFSIPFVAFFGMTALGARGLSVISAIGLILLLYLICRIIFSEKIGLIAAFLYALSPWDISLSRGGFEAHFALFLAMLGIYLFLKAKEKPIFYLFSALSFGLTLHTYPTYKLSLLFFLPLLFSFVGRKIVLKNSKKYFFLSFWILFFLAGLSLSQTFTGGSETRFSTINIFSQGKLKNSIEEKINFERNISRLPNSISKYFHNKPVEYFKILSENYLQNFSVDFLFIHGDRNPRHNMATIGQLYFVDSILILSGLLSYWDKQRKIILFLISWVILAPISTAVVDLPHALRSSFMLPPLTILSALGFYKLFFRRFKVPIFIISLFLLIQIIFFLQKLYFLAPDEYANFWAYPAKVASEIAIQNKDKYDYVFLSDRIDAIEFAYPIYAKVDSNQVMTQNSTKVNLGKYSFKKFSNVYIGSIPESGLENFLNNLKGKNIYLGNFSDAKYIKSYESIDGLNNLNTLVLTRHVI